MGFIITYKQDIKAFRVIVGGRDRSYLICVTYRFGGSKTYHAEFYQLVTTFKSVLPPGAGEPTFQESLRRFNHAIAELPSRDNIRQWIDEKMKEAFGNDITVAVEDDVMMNDNTVAA